MYAFLTVCAKKSMLAISLMSAKVFGRVNQATIAHWLFVNRIR